MIHLFFNFNKGVFVVCARAGGANTTSFLLVAHFAKRNTKFGGGKKLESENEGGQKFLPPNPLPFCPPASVPVPFEQEKSGRGDWGEFRFSFAKSK